MTRESDDHSKEVCHQNKAIQSVKWSVHYASPHLVPDTNIQQSVCHQIPTCSKTGWSSKGLTDTGNFGSCRQNTQHNFVFNRPSTLNSLFKRFAVLFFLKAVSFKASSFTFLGLGSGASCNETGMTALVISFTGFNPLKSSCLSCAFCMSDSFSSACMESILLIIVFSHLISFGSWSTNRKSSSIL